MLCALTPFIQPVRSTLAKAITPLCFAPMAAIMFTPLYAPVFASQSRPATATIDPSEIDRAVIRFTGSAIGEIGGARVAADRRLRLASCRQPLATTWHGTNRSAVRVECPMTEEGSGPWRIFVATRPLPGGAAGSKTARQGQVQTAALIKRGDPITVVVRGRGFTVQQAGEVMENGRVGEWVAIRTARKAQPVRARIERPGLAIIPSS